MPKPILGIIADDFTGGTDIASMLRHGGMQVVQTIGPPQPWFPVDADALVIALKTRSVLVDDAISQSLSALQSLLDMGVQCVQFKYCSTFDSTPEGNIGPVSDALADALGCGLVAHVPALPVNGRSVFKGHLFVGNALLSASGMENHPLNPMTDANLVSWLGLQTDRRVGLIEHADIKAGPIRVCEKMTNLRKDGTRHVIGDAIDGADLRIWAEVLQNFEFFAGGSGLAKPLAQVFAEAGRYVPTNVPLSNEQHTEEGHTLILAGSCSATTLRQIECFRDAGGYILQIDPISLNDGSQTSNDLANQAADALLHGPVLIHSSGDPEYVKSVQDTLGSDRAGKIVEEILSELASTLATEPQTGQIIVAGGETSGAVVSALDVAALRIGSEIDPGVPWTMALGASGRPILPVALKSGNFGGDDFFVRADSIIQAKT